MIPSIRVEDVAQAVDFYVEKLGFEVVRGEAAEGNVALVRGGERVMLEAAGAFYSDDYNAAIRARMGSDSPHALYLEESDLAGYYERVEKNGVEIVDPLADRPWGQAEFTLADQAGNWLTFYAAT